MSNPNVGPEMDCGFEMRGRGEAELQPPELRQMEQGMRAVAALIAERKLSRAADVLLGLHRCSRDGREFDAVKGDQLAFEREIIVV